MLGVMAARLGMVMRSVCGVTVGGMGVMGRLLVVASFVVLGSLTMMTGGMLVMLGGLSVMLGALMLHSHGCSSPQLYDDRAPKPGWARAPEE